MLRREKVISCVKVKDKKFTHEPLKFSLGSEHWITIGSARDHFWKCSGYHRERNLVWLHLIGIPTALFCCPQIIFGEGGWGQTQCSQGLLLILCQGSHLAGLKVPHLYVRGWSRVPCMQGKLFYLLGPSNFLINKDMLIKTIWEVGYRGAVKYVCKYKLNGQKPRIHEMVTALNLKSKIRGWMTGLVNNNFCYKCTCMLGYGVSLLQT